MALLLTDNPAPGGPGPAAVWTLGYKDGVGTARSLSSQVWYTVADGVITEVYYPDVDTPDVKDLQLIITDGATFFHDARKDFTHVCEVLDPDALALRMTNTAIGQPYQVVQDVIAEPSSACLLIRTRLQPTAGGTAAFVNGLRVYVLLAPHLEGFGADNSGYVARTAAGDKLVAHRGNTWLALNASCGLGMTNCGFSGINDGWQDIIGNRRLPIWNFNCAENGNIALTAEINRAGSAEFVLALAFGQGDSSTPNGALAALAEALSYPFEAPAGQYSHMSAFLEGWKRVNETRFVPKPNTTFDQNRLFNQSRNVLLTHEDKTYYGALVASLSIPWGDSAGDSDGGYHLCWPRDMSQSATALLATGEIDLPLRGLMYLAVSQSPDGSFHQKFFIDGKPAPGDAQQLDEYSFPIILAYRLSLAGALQGFDARPMVLQAAGAIIANGPMTGEERWEENEGYSPSTLATNIAALVCASVFAGQEAADQPTAQFLLEYADFLESHVEPWTVTTQGTLLAGVTRHYIRLLPTAVKGGSWDPTLPEDPNNATIFVANTGGQAFPAKEIVDAGFLELVRYGIRKAGDPLFEDSLKVVDAVLKDTLPGGPCWRRYNHDGYGQRNDGSDFDFETSQGVGRPWPLLMGERAHYDLACGRDVSAYLKAFEAFAGQHGLIAEQLWNAPDIPSANLKFGGPTGSAVPLAWAHAEYIRLVRSASDGKVFDLVPAVANRYLSPHAASPLEVWNFSRQLQSMPKGKKLRIPLSTPFRLRWSTDGWATFTDTMATATSVGINYVDISTDQTTRGPLAFTFFWPTAGHWEGTNFQVNLT